MATSPLTRSALPSPAELRDLEVLAMMRWTRVWAACANATHPRDIASAEARKLAKQRYLKEADDPADPGAIDAALASMIAAARRIVRRALDGKTFVLSTHEKWHCRLNDTGQMQRRLIFAPPLPADPVEDLATLVARSRTLFPFRRCARCRTIFARHGRQEYCTTVCTRQAELEKRKGDDAYKKRQRDAMRAYRRRKKRAKARGQAISSK